MKSDKSKKNQSNYKEEKKGGLREKPRRIRTAEGWKNYLKKRYFSKK